MNTGTKMGFECEQSVWVPAAGAALQATMFLPRDAWGMIIFAHGMGSNRNSPRNRFIAQLLQEAKLGSLLMDLLTRDETTLDDLSGHLRFDTDLLANRIAGCIDWLSHRSETRELRVGLFGAYTGAAAALTAATLRPTRADAVVSRGGRPDLASASLSRVSQPTLFIVGGEDTSIIAVNRQTINQLAGKRHLEIIPGATHLFEEAGALEDVAQLTKTWFEEHLHRTVRQAVKAS
jgi:putative phosphoribosyl transferase